MVAPIDGALQVQNNLREIYVNGSQATTLINLGAPSIVQVQGGIYNYTSTVAATPSGALYTATYDPPITEYIDGMIVSFQSPITNIGPSEFNAGAGAYIIYGLSYANLQGNELANGAHIVLQWKAGSSNWLLIAGGYSLQVGHAMYSYQAPQWGQILAGNNAMWYNMTSTRALSTTYTNSYGKPISVVAIVSNDTADTWFDGYVNGNQLFAAQVPYANNQVCVPLTVPNGETYEVINAGGGTATLVYWWELY